MRTRNAVLMAMLGAMSFNVKSNAFVSFGTSVVVEQQFSAKDLNVTVIQGNIKKGDTVLLTRHHDYLRAMKDKYIITGHTANRAEIVAFFGNEKISLEDAFTLLNNYNVYDYNNNDTIVPVSKDFYYSVELLTTEKENLQEYLKVCPELEKTLIQKDEHIFLIGQIKSHSKAIALQEKLVAAGLKNHVVVAYEGKKQVPVYLLAEKN